MQRADAELIAAFHVNKRREEIAHLLLITAFGEIAGGRFLDDGFDVNLRIIAQNRG